MHSANKGLRIHCDRRSLVPAPAFCSTAFLGLVWNWPWCPVGLWCICVCEYTNMHTHTSTLASTPKLVLLLTEYIHPIWPEGFKGINPQGRGKWKKPSLVSETWVLVLVGHYRLISVRALNSLSFDAVISNFREFNQMSISLTNFNRMLEFLGWMRKIRVNN